MTPKEWMKSQLGVWQFHYSGSDIRDKSLHPATFPLALAKRVIALFTHAGELLIDPFVGSGTTLVAARELQRNAVGFDLQDKYVRLCAARLGQTQPGSRAQQLAIHDNAWHIPQYIAPKTIALIWTSPPYANLLNRRRKNKSRRGNQRKNGQLGKVEQYSQDPHDLGTMPLAEYTQTIGDIFARLVPLLRPKAHCVINVPDMWWDNERITIHVSLIEELRRRGYELRNTIIWDRTNIVNRVGIFGWPSNYITMGTTFEYLLDFWHPTAEPADTRAACTTYSPSPARGRGLREGCGWAEDPNRAGGGHTRPVPGLPREPGRPAGSPARAAVCRHENNLDSVCGALIMKVFAPTYETEESLALTPVWKTRTISALSTQAQGADVDSTGGELWEANARAGFRAYSVYSSCCSAL
jgi:DNA modification methylase